MTRTPHGSLSEKRVVRARLRPGLKPAFKEGSQATHVHEILKKLKYYILKINHVNNFKKRELEKLVLAAPSHFLDQQT